jgi:hypothetical protein
MSGEVFLVDTNTFITPFKNYYPFDFAEPFWVFLQKHIECGDIAVMSKVYDELDKKDDLLREWIQKLSFTQIDFQTDDVTDIFRQVLDHIENSLSKKGPE